jgi:hypothetical protein
LALLLAGGCLEPIAYVPYDAAMPDIIVQPEGFSCNTGADPQLLVVEATASDGGSISYQWYSYADSSPSMKIMLNQGSVCLPFTDTKGVHYYYAEVTNYNPERPNKTAVRESVHAKVVVDLPMVRGLDLTGVIPAPLSGAAPQTASPYSGEYTVGEITWTDITGSDLGNLPSLVFLLGHTYRAAFTLHAGDGRSFAGLPVGTGSDPYAGTWKAGNGRSKTNFYHLDASTVVQALNLESTIQVTITFMPAQGIAVSSLDLTWVIPAPTVGAAASTSSPYSGEYTVGTITWTDISAAPFTPVNPVAAFLAGHTYSAGFTLSAAASRSFSGLADGVWTAGDETPSAANFFHTGAASVGQSANTGVTIGITVTFITIAQSAAPEGDGLLTAINGDATEVYFTLDQEYTGTWKVYTRAEGGDASATVTASFSMVNSEPILTLKSASPISPRAYYVSVTEADKGESGRLALWGAPLTNDTAMNLAARFRIPETALSAGAGGVSAVFNVLHAYLRDAGAVPMNDYRVSAIVLGDWVDLPSLTLAGYSNISAGYPGVAESYYPLNLTNIPVPNAPVSGSTLLRLIVVGNNSFHSRGTYWLDAVARAYNDGTPHLVFQFQNIPSSGLNLDNGMGGKDVPGLAKMNAGETNAGGYGASGMRQYLTNNYLTGLIGAGVPEAVLFAPKRYVAKDNAAAEEIQDLVWLPTMREMTGDNNGGSNGTYETQANQARLEYYDTAEKRKKGLLWDTAWTNNCYWTASPSTGRYGTNWFCFIYAGNGNASDCSAAITFGVVPAFCVK